MWETDKPSIVSLLFPKHNTHQPIPPSLDWHQEMSRREWNFQYHTWTKTALGWVWWHTPVILAHTRWDRRWRVPDQPKLYREFPVSLGYVVPSQSKDDTTTQLWLKENWISRYSCFFSCLWTLFHTLLLGVEGVLTLCVFRQVSGWLQNLCLL